MNAGMNVVLLFGVPAPKFFAAFAILLTLQAATLAPFMTARRKPAAFQNSPSWPPEAKTCSGSGPAKGTTALQVYIVGGALSCSRCSDWGSKDGKSKTVSLTILRRHVHLVMALLAPLGLGRVIELSIFWRRRHQAR
jgi:hypothetical protein